MADPEREFDESDLEIITDDQEKNIIPVTEDMVEDYYIPPELPPESEKIKKKPEQELPPEFVAEAKKLMTEAMAVNENVEVITGTETETETEGIKEKTKRNQRRRLPTLVVKTEEEKELQGSGESYETLVDYVYDFIDNCKKIVINEKKGVETAKDSEPKYHRYVVEMELNGESLFVLDYNDLIMASNGTVPYHPFKDIETGRIIDVQKAAKRMIYELENNHPSVLTALQEAAFKLISWRKNDYADSIKDLFKVGLMNFSRVVPFSTLNHVHTNQIISFDRVIVNRVQVQKQIMVKAVYECAKHHRETRYANGTFIIPPKICQKEDEYGGKCGDNNFKLLDDESIKDTYMKLSLGSTESVLPSSIGSAMELELVGTARLKKLLGGGNEHNRITISSTVKGTAIVRTRPKSDTSSLSEFYLEGLAIDLVEQEFEIKNPELMEYVKTLGKTWDSVMKVINSMAYNIKPIYYIDNGPKNKKLFPTPIPLDKLILGQIAAGADASVDPVSHQRQRGDINAFFFGPKGSGKTDMMHYLAKIFERSIVVAMAGNVTKANIIASADRSPDGGMELKAGLALVVTCPPPFAGMLGLDEFPEGNKDIQKSILELGSEAQTASILKAGFNITGLRVACSIVATGNMKPGSSLGDPISESLNMTEPMLDRFDLVYPSYTKDKKLLMSIFDHYFNLENKAINEMTFIRRKDAGLDPIPAANPDILDLETVKYYVHDVRDAYHPVISPEAVTIFRKYYDKLLDQGLVKNTPDASNRMMGKLVRVSKATARLFKSDVVTALHATIVVEEFKLLNILTREVPEEDREGATDYITNGNGRSQKVEPIFRSEVDQYNDKIANIIRNQEKRRETAVKQVLRKTLNPCRTCGGDGEIPSTKDDDLIKISCPTCAGTPRPPDEFGFNQFIGMVQAVMSRNGIPIPDTRYFESLWKDLINRGIIAGHGLYYRVVNREYCRSKKNNEEGDEEYDTTPQFQSAEDLRKYQQMLEESESGDENEDDEEEEEN